MDLHLVFRVQEKEGKLRTDQNNYISQVMKGFPKLGQVDSM